MLVLLEATRFCARELLAQTVSNSGPIVLSDSSKEVSAKVHRRKGRAKRLDVSQDSPNLVFKDRLNCLTCEDLNSKDVDKFATVTEGWLKDMEIVRLKSKSYRFSECLKNPDCLHPFGHQDFSRSS